jgi:hypothetical protein
MPAVLLRLLLSLALVLGGMGPASAAPGAAAADDAAPTAPRTTRADAPAGCEGMAHAGHGAAGMGHPGHAGTHASAQASACCHGSNASGPCSDDGGCAVRCLHAPPMLAPSETRAMTGPGGAQPAPAHGTHVAAAGSGIPIRPPIA